MTERLKLFLDTLGMHPDFAGPWKPNTVSQECPF